MKTIKKKRKHDDVNLKKTWDGITEILKRLHTAADNSSPVMKQGRIKSVQARYSSTLMNTSEALGTLATKCLTLVVSLCSM